MAKQVLKQKQKKKKWYPIYGPKLFGNQLIGECPVLSAEDMKGKYINANLSTIINNMKRQNMSITLRVKSVQDGKGFTEIIGLELVQGFVKRLVRRNRTKVDDSFVAKTKEGTLVRVKPIVMTNSNCLRSTATQLRAATKKFLTERIASQTFIENIDDILSFRVQKNAKEVLSKIFPIRSVDIRVFTREVIRGKRSETDVEEIVKEAPVEEPAEDSTPTEEAGSEAEPEAEEVKEEVSEETASDEDYANKKE